MNNCPTCKRTLEKVGQTCPRCGCDLSTLQAGDRAARQCFNAGCRALRERDFAAATAAFDRAWRWRHDPAFVPARAVAALCLGHYELALRRHGHALGTCRT
ncbi:MAG: hypothetical protein WCR06_03140 [bacterium]